MTNYSELGSERREGEPSCLDIGVFNETDSLKTVAVWGMPGPEALLAQLLPPQENLFYSSFDLKGARDEYREMLKFLEGNGVEILLVQDELLKSLNSDELPDKDRIPISAEKLEADLEKRGFDLFKRYGVGDLTTVDLIPEMINEDVQRLGERQAIVLNWLLSLRHLRPSGNIFYGRDQSNVLGDMMVWSAMRWPIRKPEVGLWKTALESQIGQERNYRIRGKNAYLEGGDGIMVNGDVYLGVGGRTSFPGACEAYWGLSDYLRENGKKMYLVADREAEKRLYCQKTPGEEMEAMHLDTFWMPFGDGRVLCCKEDVIKREVFEAGSDDGKMSLISRGNFADFTGNRFQICEIPKDEQLRYATNFLNLGDNKVIVPFSDNHTAIRHFEGNGIEVLPVEMTELGGGYGAIHCMTSALKRGC